MFIMIDRQCRNWTREERVNPAEIPAGCHVCEIPDDAIWTVHEYMHESGQCFLEELVYAADGKIRFAY